MADAADKLAQVLWTVGIRHGQLIWSDPGRLRAAVVAELTTSGHAGASTPGSTAGIPDPLLHAVAVAGTLGVPGRLANGVNADTQVSLLTAAGAVPPALAEQAVLVWWTVVRTIAPMHAVALTSDETPPPSPSRVRVARIAGLLTVIMTVAAAAVIFRHGVGSQPFDKAHPATAPTTAAAPVTTPVPTVAPASTAVPTSTAAPATTAAPAPTGGDYVALTPRRLVDTRTGAGTTDAQPGKRALVTTNVADRLDGIGVAQVKAAVLNVTIVEPTKGGYLVVAPSGSTPPGVSQLAFSDGAPVASTLVVSRLNGAGLIDVRLSDGTTAHVIVDLVGYFTIDRSPANLSVLATTPPAVLLDTRGTSAIAPNQSVDLTLPSTENGAILGVTVTGAGAPGYLTMYGGSARPDTSTVNFGTGRDATALAFIATDDDRKVHVFNGSTAPVQAIVFEVAKLVKGTTVDPLILNIDGTAAQDGRSAPFPFRTVDSRGKAACPTTLGGGVSNITTVFPKAKALLLSVTVLNATAASYLTAYAGPTAPPVASLSFAAGETRTNLAFVALAGDRVNLVCGAGSPEYLIDVIAAFE